MSDSILVQAMMQNQSQTKAQSQVSTPATTAAISSGPPTWEELLERNKPEAVTKPKKANIILVGGLGTGKTFSITTAPKPVWVHSFDPGGMDTIRQYIDNKNIIVDEQFEGDNPSAPTKFAQWDAVYHKMKQDKIFDHLGTFVLDSATTWSDAIMNYVLQKVGRPGSFPQQNDYPQQMSRIKNAIDSMLALPCNLMFIAHPALMKDDVTGRVYSAPMLTGKLSQKIPLLFSEIYYATTNQNVNTGKLSYKFLTQPTGLFNARTRLGGGGKLQQYEDPNVSAILRKCGVIE